MNSRGSKIGLLVLAVCAFGLETAGWSAFFTDAPPQWQQRLFFLCHGLGSMVSGAFMVGILPSGYRQSLLPAFFFFFLICLFIPGLGLIGLLLSVWPAFFMHRRSEHSSYLETEVPELPYKPLKIQEKLIYGQAGMVSILRHSQDPERRIRAVMATRQMTSQEAIPVLKEALRDPVDDVRLLAYSMLDAKEEKINDTIRSLQAHLESDEPDQHRDLHERVSNCYWELAYLGLAQGEVLRHALNRSLFHIEQAMVSGANEPGLHIQHGRLLMHQQRWDAASEAFASAIAKGIPETSVAPYLAEIAYAKRDFHQVVKYIRRLGPSIRKSERLAAVAAYWT
jgi:hypothetical protein